jgi:hypothetical protein
MFVVARDEMSERPKKDAGFAAADSRASTDEADPATTGGVRTGEVSGDRSASSLGSRAAERKTSSLVDPGLRRLAADLGDDFGIVERFVTDYLSLADRRLSGLDELLDADDIEATRLWVLSLETTSAMLGAIEVVSAARVVREAVELGQDAAARQAFPVLQQAVRRLQASLAAQGFTAQPSSRSAAG